MLKYLWLGQQKVGRICMNGVLWHTVLFGTGRILKRHHSELALDRLDTGDPFGVHPQQNDTDGQPCLFLCKGWLSE